MNFKYRPAGLKVALAVAIAILLSGCIFYFPKPDCTMDGSEFCRGVIPTGFVEQSLPEWLAPSDSAFSASPSDWNHFRVSRDRSVAALTVYYDCFLSCHSKLIRFYDLEGVHRFDVESNGTVRVVRDHNPENFVSWYLMDRSFHIENRSGEQLQHIQGVTSDGIPFLAEVRDGYHVNDGPVQWVTFLHPTFGEQKIWPKPARISDSLTLPDASSNERIPLEVSRSVIFDRQVDSYEIPGIQATVPSSEIDVLCLRPDGEVNASAPLAQGLTDGSRSACFFEWDDADGDGMLGPGDRYTFRANNHYLGFHDKWADRRVTYG